MPENPQKCEGDSSARQVVSKKQYLLLHGKKFWLYAGSAATLGFAGLYLLMGINTFIHWKSRRYGFPEFLQGDFGAIMVVFSSGVFVAAGLSTAVKRFRASRKYSKEIAPILPLTEHNALLIPPEEILVRSSEIPTADSPTVLLRAVQQGTDTPSEQLLRAGPGEIE